MTSRKEIEKVCKDLGVEIIRLEHERSGIWRLEVKYKGRTNVFLANVFELWNGEVEYWSRQVDEGRAPTWGDERTKDA